MNKVLIVAYAFPPVGGGGVQRPVKFVKYLRHFNWEPLVLTVDDPPVPLRDESLMGDIPQDVRVYRARTLEPTHSAKKQYVASGEKQADFNVKGLLRRIFANLLLPDVQVLWWPGLITQLVKVIRLERPDCLFVTAPPFSSFIPVVAIGKLFGIPVIIDYRDEWLYSRQVWENAVKTPFAFWLDREMERFVVKNCHVLVAVNASYIESLYSNYPHLDKEKTKVITNGYDHDDFVHVKKSVRTGNVVNMVYAGTVWNGNSLEPLVIALKKLLEGQPAYAELLQIHVYGRVVDSQQEYLQDQSVSRLLQLHGYLDHSRVLEEMFSADVLLLTMTDLAGAEKIILGKVFEYLATGKHILAIVPKGETQRILEANSCKLHLLHPDDTDGIITALKTIVDDIESTRKRSNNQVEQFSRYNLTKELVTVFDNAVASFDNH